MNALIGRPLAIVTGALDRLTGRVTMYRLVTLLLGLLAVIALIFSLTGDITYTPRQLLASAAVLLVVTYLANRLIAAAFSVVPHSESSIITALLLFFLLLPTDKPAGLLMLAIAGVLASASKYLLAFRGRHIFNPAAAGAVLIYLFYCLVSAIWPDSASVFPLTAAGWWVASETLFPFVLVFAFLVLFRTRKLAMGLTFVVLALALVVYYLMDTAGQGFGAALNTALFSYPIIFLAGFMLSEPLTLPPLKWQQYTLAVGVAALVAYPLLVGSVQLGSVFLLSGPEWALVVGNVFAFLCGQRKGIRLTFRGKRRLTPTTYEFEFESRRPISARAGQYMELTIPHDKVDSRGIRRVFSLTSAPGEDRSARFGVKMAEKSSTFKTAFADLKPGDEVSATAVGGDFLLPSDASRPLLLVAGGIGITPYISHLGQLAASGGDRDVILVYGVNDISEIAYTEELVRAGTRVLLVAPERPADLPANWQFAPAAYVSADLLARHVPDVTRRHAYVSGPPVMVNAVAGGLRGLGVSRVRTDRFSGY
ncbi:FAD-dependent oxidoreductase [Nakamurella silvestris]|nr:FAD-dependent oxidoreductase [Nakamurella silvestris]